jgi:DNA-binding response OmpR family regulator
MTEDERFARIQELQGTIFKARDELKKMEPPRSFLMELQEELDEMDAERAAGDDYDTKARNLGNLLAAGLNLLNEHVQGEVVVHAGEVSVGTDVGDLRWNGEEWYFMERP